MDFVEEAQFERLGVFKYSEEEDTAAAQLAGTVPQDEKERRWQELMELQSVISRKKNNALIGTTQRVIIDNLDFDSGKVIGRTQAHAPEVDGVVYMDGLTPGNQTASPRLGDMMDARISDALDYDLIGEKLNAQN